MIKLCNLLTSNLHLIIADKDLNCVYNNIIENVILENLCFISSTLIYIQFVYIN